MQSSIRVRILRNYVAVSQPWLVDNDEMLKYLSAAQENEEYGEADPMAVGGDEENFDEISEQAALNNAIALEIKNEAKKEADKILAEAGRKAAAILAEAEAGAKEIRLKAKEESERLCAEAVEQVRAEAYPKAREEGYEAGRQAGEEEGRIAFQDAAQVLGLAQRAMQEEYARVDEDLLHLAIKIAERLVRCSLFIEPQLLKGIISEITLLPQERQNWVLHVAPEDVLWLEREQPPCPCPWVVNESLSAGDCFLECQEGYFDARLEAQLDKLEHALREELQYGAMEPVAGNS